MVFGIFKSMKILVTGASGFIGKKLVKRLIAEKHQVRIFLRKKNREDVWNDESIEKFIGHFDQMSDLLKATRNIDVVCHLAAVRDKWGTSWQEYQRVNIENTNNLLNASINNKVKQFIYCSSISVITPPFDRNYYGKSKKEAEKTIRQFTQEQKINFTIVRPVITYGPGDNGMIFKLISMIEKGKYLTVGDGKNHVHLCYIDDLIEGFVLVLGNKKAFGQTYCFCGSQSITVNYLIYLIEKMLGKKIHNIHIPFWFAKLVAFILESIYRLFRLKNEPMITLKKIEIMTVDRHFSYEKAKKELGYIPKFDYKQGLKLTIRELKGKNE